MFYRCLIKSIFKSINNIMQYKNCRKQFSFFTRISVYINLTCLLQVNSLQVFTPKKVFTKCICNFFFVSFSHNINFRQTMKHFYSTLVLIFGMTFSMIAQTIVSTNPENKKVILRRIHGNLLCLLPRRACHRTGHTEMRIPE